MSHEWIAIKERLPENGQYVIASDGRFVGELQFEIVEYSEQTESDLRGKKKQKFVFLDQEGDQVDLKWTHWMPLPNPPKEINEP